MQNDSILIHYEFIKELLRPLSESIYDIKKLESIFLELAKVLDVRGIFLYEISNDWEYKTVCSFWNMIDTPLNWNVILDMNLYLSWKLKKTSSIPLPKSWSNIVIPVWVDWLFLAAGWNKKSRDIEKVENSIFELTAKVIANSLKSIALITQANTDKLTCVKNRNALDKLILEWKNTFGVKIDSPIALCMLDIDFFKKFNDTYWHDIWDLVLKHTASVCSNALWETNEVYRFWWEEFTIVIYKPEWDLSNYIDSVRQAIAETPMIKDGASYNITVSIWVREIWDETHTQALKLADKALYTAKEWWRNRISIYK